MNGITAIGASLGGVLGGAILNTGFAWLCAVMLTALLLAFGLPGTLPFGSARADSGALYLLLQPAKGC